MHAEAQPKERADGKEARRTRSGVESKAPTIEEPKKSVEGGYEEIQT